MWALLPGEQPVRARPCLTPPRLQRRWTMAKYTGAGAVAAAGATRAALLELWGGYGKNVYTALGTVGGNVVGVVATAGNDDGLVPRMRFQGGPLCAPVRCVQHSVGDAVRQQRRLCAQRHRGRGRRPARGRAPWRLAYADATTAKVAVVTGQGRGPRLGGSVQCRPAPLP